MATQVKWRNHKQQILILKFEGHFTLQDLRDARRIEGEMTAEIEHRFHLLYDFESITKLHNLPNGLVDYYREHQPLPPTVDYVVVIVPKWARSLARAFLEVGRIFNPQPAKNVHIVHSKQDAFDFLDAVNKNKSMI